MRPATAGPAGRLLHLLLAPAVALLAVACDDSSSVQEPPVADEGLAASQAPTTIARAPGHWADGYTTVSTVALPSGSSFNRSGGAITSTSPEPYRSIVTFSGLSAHLGSTSTLHVTAAFDFGGGATFCKPVEGYLVRDNVEVRCYFLGTGLPVDATHRHFALTIMRNYSDVAYAYAHRPTSTNYSPKDRGSWNPAGATTVFRTGVGQYQVVFYELQRIVWDANNNGHWQVNAVGDDNVYCKLASGGGSTAMFANVRCYTPAGNPADSKFTVLFVLPSAHLAYTRDDQPSAPPGEHTPNPFDSWTPAGSWIGVNRYGTGIYRVTWDGVDSQIVGWGSPHVTAEGSDNAVCWSTGWGFDYVGVKCLSPNGVPVDSRFRVLLGS